MAKLFDSMAKLKFKEDESGEQTKEATTMFSKDGEDCLFDSPCMCVGPVEDWLNKLLDTMKSTVRYQFTEAVVA